MRIDMFFIRTIKPEILKTWVEKDQYIKLIIARHSYCNVELGLISGDKN